VTSHGVWRRTLEAHVEMAKDVGREDSLDAESQRYGVAVEDSQDAEGQRNAMMVSGVLLSSRSHRQTSVLGTDIQSGTDTEAIQATPIVVPTVPPAMLVGPHSDCQNLPSINGSVGGMDIPTDGVGSTLLYPQVGISSGLDGCGGTVHHVTEHWRARTGPVVELGKLKISKMFLTLAAVVILLESTGVQTVAIST
jgi:hypothetical protein